jgi:hypothetical protein
MAAKTSTEPVRDAELPVDLAGDEDDEHAAAMTANTAINTGTSERRARTMIWKISLTRAALR